MGIVVSLSPLYLLSPSPSSGVLARRGDGVDGG